MKKNSLSLKILLKLLANLGKIAEETSKTNDTQVNSQSVCNKRFLSLSPIAPTIIGIKADAIEQ
jgi:hypothetical protein